MLCIIVYLQLHSLSYNIVYIKSVCSYAWERVSIVLLEMIFVGWLELLIQFYHCFSILVYHLTISFRLCLFVYDGVNIFVHISDRNVKCNQHFSTMHKKNGKYMNVPEYIFRVYFNLFLLKTLSMSNWNIGNHPSVVCAFFLYLSLSLLLFFHF